MGLPLISVNIPPAPAQNWRLTNEEAEVATRAVEGGLIDDLLGAYKALSGDRAASTRLNNDVAGRLTALFDRPVSFPDHYGERVDEPRGWETPGWQRIARAIIARVRW